MGIILGKSRALKPNATKEIRYVSPVEKKVIDMAKNIAKDFGVVSKKMKKSKIIIR